jgi:hypothetical protein
MLTTDEGKKPEAYYDPLNPFTSRPKPPLTELECLRSIERSAKSIRRILMFFCWVVVMGMVFGFIVAVFH